MGKILRNWRINLAVVFSLVLIGGSFLLARDIEMPVKAQASTESALLKAIATKDTDNDGLSDWEEALYGTDSRVVDSFELGMTDAEAVARGLVVPKAVADIQESTTTPIETDEDGLPVAAEGTLTAAFTQTFLSLYSEAKDARGGADLSEEDLQQIATEAVASLSAISAAPDYKRVKDLKIVGSGADALKEFAMHAEAVMVKNTTDADKDPLEYLGAAIQGEDAAAFGHLSSLSKMYRDIAAGLAALPVPVEMAGADLVLINALMRMGEICSDFAREEVDPLAAILALQQYLGVAQALGTAFTQVGNVYHAFSISLPAGAPGALFVNLIADVNSAQKP